MKRSRPRARLVPVRVKVDFLIPRLQDDTRRPHPHTAYEEWNTLLTEYEIHPPTQGPVERGSEGWGKRPEDSLHWWTGVDKEQVATLLRLLKDDARRIFHQRWIVAWIGEEFYELGDVPRPKRRR